MAAFKNKDNGTWYVQFRYTDWRGERQQKLKRGFPTKKAALAWEREFLMKKQADLNMTLESFVELYTQDVKPKLKLNTWLTKESIIKPTKGQMLRFVHLPCLKRYCWPGRRRTPGGSGFPSRNSYPCRFASLAGRSGLCRLLVCLRSAVCFPISLDRDIGKTPNPWQGCWSVCPFSSL